MILVFVVWYHIENTLKVHICHFPKVVVMNLIHNSVIIWDRQTRVLNSYNYIFNFITSTPYHFQVSILYLSYAYSSKTIKVKIEANTKHRTCKPLSFMPRHYHCRYYIS